MSAAKNFAVGALLSLLVWSCSGDPLVQGDPYPTASSEFQTGILEDGKVSLSEMETAVFAYAECLERLGVETRAEYDSRAAVWDYWFSADGIDVETILDGTEGVACKQEYLDDVEIAFAQQVGPSQEEDAAFYAAIGVCMEESGFNVDGTDPDSMTRLYELAPDEYLDCFDAVAGLP